MRSSMGRRRYVSESTWLTLSRETLNGMMVAALLATAASFFLISSGMHETAIVPIVSAVGVIAIGFALVTLFDHWRVEGVPLIE
jgi:multisubunit Na+/H+ antiporter MnhC subunit